MPRIGLRLPVAIALASFTINASPAMAQRDKVFDDVEAQVTYQYAGQYLGFATQCDGTPSWKDFNSVAALADYKASREYLDANAPGRRIWADSETFRYLAEMGRLLGSDGVANIRYCESQAPPTKYRKKH